MLVAKNRIVETVVHDFSSIILVPTVARVNDLPIAITVLWYWEKLYIYVKIFATEPSSALQNAVEIGALMNEKYLQ